jgi:predicted phage-related endonuclease
MAAAEVRAYSTADRDAWLERRPRYLNASDNAALFGLHKFKTLAQLVARMRGVDGIGALDPDPESALIRRGHALEDDAIDEVQKLRPAWRISKCEHQYVDEQQRIAATPDYIAIDPEREGRGVLQVKVVNAQAFKRDWADAPPLMYLLQLSQEMMLTPDCTWGAVVALCIGDFSFEASLYPIERNNTAEVRLRTAAAEFWRTYDAGEHPAIDFERDGALIALMFPKEVPGKVVDLSTDNAIGDLLTRREILRDTAKDVEKRLTAVENEIKAKIGDAEAALVPGWRITFKQQHRAAHEVKATSFRVLRATRHEQERPAASS